MISFAWKSVPLGLPQHYPHIRSNPLQAFSLVRWEPKRTRTTDRHRERDRERETILLLQWNFFKYIKSNPEVVDQLLIETTLKIAQLYPVSLGIIVENCIYMVIACPWEFSISLYLVKAEGLNPLPYRVWTCAICQPKISMLIPIVLNRLWFYILFVGITGEQIKNKINK